MNAIGLQDWAWTASTASIGLSSGTLKVPTIINIWGTSVEEDAEGWVALRRLGGAGALE